jgi:hypothetical protein
MSSDDERRDEVLKRMLATPPKPHDDQKRKPARAPKARQEPKASSDAKD